MPRNALLGKMISAPSSLVQDLEAACFLGFWTCLPNMLFWYPRMQREEGRKPKYVYITFPLWFSLLRVGGGRGLYWKPKFSISLHSFPYCRCYLYLFIFHMRKLKCTSFRYFWQQRASFLWGVSDYWRRLPPGKPRRISQSSCLSRLTSACSEPGLSSLSWPLFFRALFNYSP